MIEIKINSKQLLLEGATIEKWKAEESLRAMMQAYLEGRPKGTKPKINPDTGAFSFDNPTGKVEVGTETLPGQRSKGPPDVGRGQYPKIKPTWARPLDPGGTGFSRGVARGPHSQPATTYMPKTKLPSARLGPGYTLPLETIEVLSNGDIIINSDLRGHYSAGDLRKLDADGILPKRWVKDYQLILDEIADMVATQSKGWRALSNSKEFRLAKGETVSLARRVAQRIKTTVGASWSMVINRLDPTAKIYRRQMSAIGMPPLTKRGRKKISAAVDKDIVKVKRDLAKARAKNTNLMNTPGSPEKKIAAQGQRAAKLRETLVALQDLKSILDAGGTTKKTLGGALKRAGAVGARGLGKLAGYLMLPVDAVIIYQMLQDAQSHGATSTEALKLAGLAQGHDFDALGELLLGWAGYQDDWFVHKEFFQVHARVETRYYLAWSKMMYLKQPYDKIPIGTKTPGGPWTAEDLNTLRRVAKYQKSGVDLVDPALRRRMGKDLRGFMEKALGPSDPKKRGSTDPSDYNLMGPPSSIEESKNYQRSKNKIKIKISS